MADLDGDGTVTNGEISKHERLTRLDNWDRQQDQQRHMAWVAMVSMVGLTAALILPVLSTERIEALSGLMTMFYTAQMGVVAAFMGASAYVRTRERDDEG
ncbi:MAG: hypothetical protein ACO3RX_06335 [Chthoniobacterales bacterium]